MIYLIGGPVRVGKSRLARLCLERQKISAVSTDALAFMIGRVLPETRLAGRGIPQEEWEQNFYPFLNKFIKNILVDFDDYVIEGAVLSPEITHRLSETYELKCCYLGKSVTSVNELMAHLGNNQWLRNATAEELQVIPKTIVDRSQFLASECRRLGYPYVDLAPDYTEGMERAYQFLFGDS